MWSRVHVYIYAIALKLSIITFFQSFPSCQYIETILLEEKILAGFEHASFILGVLGLAHYTTADDTVSHFSYEPLFKGPHFFHKNAGIEHSLWWFTYWHFICLMTSKKHIWITHVSHFAMPKANLTKVHDCTCILNVYIFYLRFALGIIHGDLCDRKTPKTIILFK